MRAAFLNLLFSVLIANPLSSGSGFAAIEPAKKQVIVLSRQDLEDRLRCATTKVLIKHFMPKVATKQRIFEGTAFFVDGNGTMVTAGHNFTDLLSIPFY
jgi:hypothetical protein